MTDPTKPYPRAGPGWRYLGRSVWQHASGWRVHACGNIARSPDGRHYRLSDFETNRLEQYMTRRRAVMGQARILMENQP